MSETTGTRVARCACGGLTATAAGAPAGTHLCSCQECQRRSGSAFSYAGVYPESAVTIAGRSTSFRQTRDSGRWVELTFCPTCGVTLYWRVEAFPGMIGISAGCFADPDYPAPRRLFWAAKRHRWLEPPTGVKVFDAQ